jgi:hypothetical protein
VTRRRYIPEDSNLHTRRLENLKSVTNGFVVEAEGRDMFRPEAISAGGNMNPSGNLSLTKINLVALVEGLCDVEIIILADGVHDWESKITENLIQGSRLVLH